MSDTRFIHLDFSYADLNPNIKNEFIDKVVKSMNERFNDTNVVVIDNDDLANHFSQSYDLKKLFVHNDNPDLDVGGEAYIGTATDKSWGEIDISELQQDHTINKMDSLAERLSEVASHEGYHLFGPYGHSGEPIVNLMSDGEIIGKAREMNPGLTLGFTEKQKLILNQGIEGNLSELENNIELMTFDTTDNTQDHDSGDLEDFLSDLS